MIFSKESIEKIINNQKQQTRRLVKEGELATRLAVLDFREMETVFFNSKGRIKWQVGKSYVVCPGRGKFALYFCPECKAYAIPPKSFLKQKNKDKALQCGFCVYHGIMKPLRIRIKAIRKEKLLDITEKDARKEGFVPEGGSDKDDCWEITAKEKFLGAFCDINKKSAPLLPKGKRNRFEFFSIGSRFLQRRYYTRDFETWNPDVWVLEFEVEN